MATTPEPLSGLALYTTYHAADEVLILDTSDTTMGSAGTDKRIQFSTLLSMAGMTSGTVTSVSWTGDGTIFTASADTPVTTSGTLTPALATQTKNTLLAGPTSGSNAAPTFRALVAADLPAALTPATITITPTASGALLVNRMGSGSGNGQSWGIEISNAANSDVLDLGCASSAYTTGGGIGWIPDGGYFMYLPSTLTIGTGIASTGAIASFSSTGVDIPNGTLGIGGNQITFGSAAPTAGTWAKGDVCFNTGVTSTTSPCWSCTTAGTPGTWTVCTPNLAASQITSGQLAVAQGGTGQATAAAGFNALSPMTTAGDVIIGGTSGAGTRLGIGSTNQVLTVVSGAPAWAAATGGFTNPMTTAGDEIIGGSGGTAQRLAVGSNGQVHTVVSGAPAWANPVTESAVVATLTTSFSGMTGSFQNIGLSITLPVAGTYLITAVARGDITINGTAGQQCWIIGQIYDTTNSVVLSHAATTSCLGSSLSLLCLGSLQVSSVAISFQQATPFETVIYTVTGATVLNVQACYAATGGTITGPAIYSDTNGATSISAVRIY